MLVDVCKLIIINTIGLDMFQKLFPPVFLFKLCKLLIFSQCFYFINTSNSPNISQQNQLISTEKNCTGTILVAADRSFPEINSSLSSSEGRICPSIDVRNRVSNLDVLRGCRVVEGSVHIVLIDHANETDYDSVSFPELREITQYLLLYR